MITSIASLTAITLVLVVALVVAAIAVRRRVLVRRGGTVQLFLRLAPTASGRGWVLGLARFDADALRCYRLLSLAVRPRRTLVRRDLTVVSRRDPLEEERRALLAGATVMHCRSSTGSVELAMGPSALTGFLAWIEAAPPGATLPG